MDIDKYRILIVDNYPAMQKYLAHCLKHLGSITCANDAVEALQILKSDKFDLIVSEVDLPILSGSEFCCVVKEKFPNIPMLYTTSRREFEARRILGDCQPDGMICKPFEPKPFQTLAEKLVGYIPLS